MLYLAGIAITFFLAILLAGKKNKSRADRILMIWLCTIALHLVQYYLFITGKLYEYPVLLGVHIPFPLLHGPLLYLYTSALTRQQPKNPVAWIMHFIPAIILYLALVPFFNLPAAERIMVYRNQGAGYETLMQIALYAIIISGIGYVTASLLLLRRYRKSIKEEFSTIEKINLAWLRYLIYGTAVIWTAVLVGNDEWVFGTVVLFVFFLGYFGIRQAGIFALTGPQHVASPHLPAAELPKLPNTKIYQGSSPTPENISAQGETRSTEPKIKYEKSGLGEEQAGRIYKDLVGCMENQKPFSDSELTLATLAKTLDVHPNHLSQVINTYEGKNFYDYINFHRVEEFKRLAPRPDNINYTLLSLAYECGFNSKTSFNRNFKKVTGVSPSEYLSQQQISLK